MAEVIEKMLAVIGYIWQYLVFITTEFIKLFLVLFYVILSL